ncbi:hypothetical protein QN277_020121 [Acacia crassicarpa]|uniref:Uncharacterized protein n=1 Tax=Acacia crassicarpa TaxID=499986 RepID=A0AAE1MSD9_9FABA|nr:hypothetical protein QN277_020121 [Acacia crassicarpa]
MEEREFSLELKFMNFISVESLFSPFGISSHPLFSFTVTLCTLILLYLPHHFWKLVLSPVLILTVILLLTILRFGANQRSQNEQPEISGTPEPGLNQENRASLVAEEKEESENLDIETEESHSLQKVRQWISTHSETEFKTQMGFSSECFVESWEVKAPLEVIYEEEYEEGEEAEADQNEKEDAGKYVDYPKYPLLSRYSPESESETESDSSSEGGFPQIGQWESPENNSFQWDEEDKEGLIEIALDGGKKIDVEFQYEEDNLIEIDISPTRADEFPGENEAIAGEID